MNTGGEEKSGWPHARSSETTTGEATMKTVLAAISVMVLMTVAFAGAPQHAVGAGNGAPSGPHYNLNIIGVPKDKSARSEERRVGKECRCRWRREHERKKNTTW